MQGKHKMSLHEEKVTAINTGVAASSLLLYGITLENWVLIATLLYFVLQIGLMIPKYVTIFKEWRSGKNTPPQQ